MMLEKRVCRKCGAVNRVDPSRAGAAVCGKCGSSLAAPAGPIIITDANFSAEVERCPVPVLVDFWAAWCGPCRMVAPIIDQLAGELAGRAVVGKLDVDANKITAGRFRVQGIPSLLIFDKGGEVDRIVGVQPKAAILKHLEKFL